MSVMHTANIKPNVCFSWNLISNQIEISILCIVANIHLTKSLPVDNIKYCVPDSFQMVKIEDLLGMRNKNCF